MSKLKVAGLFAGVGGSSQGFISQGFEIEFAIEYDKDIAKSYKLIIWFFPLGINTRDVYHHYLSIH